MKNFCLPKDYDKNVFPRDNLSIEPIEIKLEFDDVHDSSLISLIVTKRSNRNVLRCNHIISSLSFLDADF